MSLEIIYGDLFNEVMGKECILAQGCNAQGAFGSGVAGLVKKLYPFAYKAYMSEKHRLHTGQVIIATCEKCPVIVANCITQEFYGREGKQYVSYNAIVETQQTVAKFAKEHNLPVYLPLIGGGLGGGDEKRLTNIFQAVYHDTDATLVLFN
jgi:O-acetyl-ADP-ribose deacetylase (regulator of RNase III)